MKPLLAAALLSLAIMSTGIASTFIHVHRTSPTELGITCSNGNSPALVGQEESTLIVSCNTPKPAAKN